MKAQLQTLSFLLTVSSFLIQQISGSVISQNLTVHTEVQKSVSGYCSRDTDCWTVSSINSRCYSGRCICDLGYKPVNGYCTKILCSYNSDCTQWQVLTRCSFGTCYCVSGTYTDTYSQTCRYNSGGGGVHFSVGIPVGVVGFCIFVALIVCCCVRSRRNRIQTTRRVVAQPVPVSTTHVVLPPSNQAYQGYQNPAAGYQNPNYYQQQPPQPQQNPAYMQAPPPPYNPNYQPPQPAPPTGAPYPTKY